LKKKDIIAKFGDAYQADERTFMMGMDSRITGHIARRFEGRRVLETCTGAGFTTIALARVAERVTSIEIDPVHQQQAYNNLARAGLSDRVSLLLGDVLDENILRKVEAVDAAFLDPDWALTGENHQFRFRRSNTCPPMDRLLDRILSITGNIALIVPPFSALEEFTGLPGHERQKIFLEDSLELFCLYFGELGESRDETELRIRG